MLGNKVLRFMGKLAETQNSHMQINLPWWPSCLDHGALINADVPGCGTSVVRGQMGYK